MGEYNQREFHEISDSHTVWALYNPNKDVFESEVKSKKLSVFDIGCGYPPLLSFKLKPNELWVGCDPDIIKNPKGKTIFKDMNIEKAIFTTTERGKNIGVKSIFNTTEHGTYIFYRDIAAEVPQFYPDIFSFVAPNQEDIHKGAIINYDLEKFLSPNKKQALALVLDTITVEEYGYQGSAIHIIKKMMKEFGFKINISNKKPSLLIPYSAYSANLSENNIYISGERNPK